MQIDNSKSERTAFADPRLGSNAYGGTINVSLVLRLSKLWYPR